MPTNQHLKWADIRDFAPGLWTEGSTFAMPPTAAQQMDNCVAMPGGGLRAFFKPTTFTKSGLTLTSEKATGFFNLLNTLRTDADVGALDHWLMTANESTKVSKLYRLDGTDGDTSWSVIKTWAAGTFDAYAPASMMAFFTTELMILASGGFGGGADTGLWSFAYDDATAAEVAAGAGATISLHGSIHHQSRVVAHDGSAPANTSRIWYSDPGALTFPAANFININPSDLTSQNVLMKSYAPSDLLVGKANGTFSIVQGEITDPVVRDMGGSHLLPRWTTAAITPEGLAIIVPEDSVYLTSTGESFDDIGAQLDFSTLTSLVDGIGDPIWNENYLLLPQGYVFDWRSKAWSRLTAWSNVHHQFLQRAPNLSATSGIVSAVYATDSGVDPALRILEMTDGSTRQSTYTWKSAPYRSDDGRQIEIREVQVYIEAQDSSAQVAVTVNGTTRTLTGLAAGRHQLTFPFLERGEMLDVTVTPTAGSADNEAPVVEVVRIGQGQGHLLH